MIEAFLLALITAKIKRLRLAPLFREWPVYILLAYAALHLYTSLSIFHGNFFFARYAVAFKVVYALILGLFILKYNLYKAGFLGVAFIIFGGVLNSIVMNANGGKMPVFPTLSYLTGAMKPEFFGELEKYDPLHMAGDSAVNLPFLSDIVDLGYIIISIGDVFIISVVFLLVYNTIKLVNAKAS